MSDDYREVFYGGAAGGGKSDALLMAALMYVDVPGYAAIIFRRTYADLSLPGALIPRAHEWLQGTDATWKDQTKTWHFPSGATLTFGYLDNANDKYRYQSSEFQFCGFDELTQFPMESYLYLFSRLRKLKTSSIPLRMRSASNPGGDGHEWVKERFITSVSQGRGFIPATLDDNPYIDAVDYNKMLDNLDHVTRRQLRYGDWDIAVAGNKFKAEWMAGRVKSHELPDLMKAVRFWDLAATEEKPGTDPDYTAGCLLGKDKNNTLYVIDMRRERGSPATIEKLIEETAQFDRSKYGEVGTHIEQEGGASGKFTIDQFVRRVLYGYDVHGQRVSASKILRANPVSAQMEHGNIKVVEGAWNEAFIRELVAFPNKGVHDDQVDALSGAFSKVIGRDWGAS